MNSSRRGFDDLVVPFIFVPRGEPVPADWLARHPGAVRIPATLVPRSSERQAIPQAVSENDGLDIDTVRAARAEPAPDPASNGMIAATPVQFAIETGTSRSDPTAAVPFVDDQGRPVLDGEGSPILRPVGLDPHMFVEAGLKDRQFERDMMNFGGGTGAFGAVGYAAGQLGKFGRGSEWDAQRVSGHYHPEYVDYATIAIGLYAAAAGFSRDEILAVENFVAIESHYKIGTSFDDVYSYLPKVNVANTDHGYELFKSGSISSRSPTGAAK